MKISHRDLVEIAEKSCTLDDLLSFCKDNNIKNEADAPDVDNFLERWQKVFDDNDSSGKFKKRLLWDGLDIDTVRRALKKARDIYKSHRLPSWTKTLKDLVDFLDDCLKTAPYRNQKKEPMFLTAESPVPFQELLLYFVIFARNKLTKFSGGDYNILSEKAHSTLERGLLQILSNLSELTLQLEFSLHRLKKEPGFNIPGLPVSFNTDGVYDDFIRKLLKGVEYADGEEGEGLVIFFKEYSVLAKLLAQSIKSWIECTLKFIKRLKSDWQKIRKTFQIQDETCRVVAIRPYLSDLHDGGYAVMAFILSTGNSLVYKPRDVGMECAYYKLLEWLNKKNITLPFKILKVLNGKTHGWIEYIGPKKCESEKDREDYYHRAGMLLFILYSLYGKDFHCENIIASQNQPVIVDLETLFHPEVFDPPGFPKKTRSKAARIISYNEFENSVLRTDFLPQHNFDYYDLDFDISGLTALSKQRTSFLVPDWKNINKDNMDFELRAYHLESFYNIPQLEKEQTSPQQYVENIISGFKEMYKILKMNREEFISSTGPLAEFKSVKARFLFRPSKVYGYLLYKCINPGYLREGLSASFEFETLYRKALGRQEKPKWWGVIHEEQRALYKMNVPYFTTKTDSKIIKTIDGEAVPCIMEPGYSLALSRLKNFDEDDLIKQISLIRASLNASD